MNIAVISNPAGEGKIETPKLIDFLEKRGNQVQLEQYDYQGRYSDAFYRRCEVVLAVGGDGTIIRTAKHFARYGKPILGINAGNLGYTAEMECGEWNCIQQLLDGNYRLESRLILEGTMYPKNGKLSDRDLLPAKKMAFEDIQSGGRRYNGMHGRLGVQFEDIQSNSTQFDLISKNRNRNQLRTERRSTGFDEFEDIHSNSSRSGDQKSNQNQFYAMNEFVVSGSAAKMVNYAISVDNHEAYTERSDGFILATPTGSTAYALSAGGAMIDPGLSCMEYIPVCPHSLVNRAVLFQDHTILRVRISERNFDPVFLSADGEEPIRLQGGDQLSFRKAAFSASFVRFPHRNFYDQFHEKMVSRR